MNSYLAALRDLRVILLSFRGAIATTTVAILPLWLCSPALAHHPFGGNTPTNGIEGFLSGLGHPVIGLDHLAFVTAAGLLAAAMGQSLLIPAIFVAGSVVGTGLHLMGLDLPAPELVIAASVLVVGILLAMKNPLGRWIVVGIAAASGLFHGYAYGEAVVGARMDALVFYLAGFSVIQMAIATLTYGVAKQFNSENEAQALYFRFAGFTLAGIGGAFLSGVLLG